MNHRVLVLHVEDIALKGANRPYFFKILVKSIKARLLSMGKFIIQIKENRAIINSSNIDLLERAFHMTPYFVGVASARLAISVKVDLELIKEAALVLAKSRRFRSFRVHTKRSYKKHSFSSAYVNVQVGSAIKELTNVRVDLSNPECTFRIDVLKNEAFVSVEYTKGLGGLPVGSSGKALVLLSGGIDSPVASFLCMQRGLKLSFIHFTSFPYVSFSNEEKIRSIVGKLAAYQGSARLYVVPFGQVQQRLYQSVPNKYLVIFYRRFMVRIASFICKKYGYEALVTGDSLGQVASQTLQNIHVISEASNMLILRPLVGMGKRAIVDMAKKLETFETSIKLDQDCCQLFAPKHPKTRAKSENVKHLESSMPINEWIDEALKQIKIEEITIRPLEGLIGKEPKI